MVDGRRAGEHASEQAGGQVPKVDRALTLSPSLPRACAYLPTYLSIRRHLREDDGGGE